MLDPTRPPQRLQFRMRYLLYVLTVAAIGSTILRHILAFRAGWAANAMMGAYVALLVAYFVIRFPLLLRKFWRRQQSDAVRRNELRKLVEETRERRTPESP